MGKKSRWEQNEAEDAQDETQQKKEKDKRARTEAESSPVVKKHTRFDDTDGDKTEEVAVSLSNEKVDKEKPKVSAAIPPPPTLSKFAPSKQAAAPIVNAKQAEVESKRKLIWSHKKEDVQAKQVQSTNSWEETTFDGDDQRRNKFLKLMGVKNPAATESKASASKASIMSAPSGEKEKKLLDELEREYEAGRARQHFQGRSGLGSS